MTDSLYGALGAISAATKTTDVYSADYIDLGSIASKSRFTYHTMPPDLFCVFSNEAAAMNAADSYIPFLYQDTDSGFATNNAKLITGAQTGLGLAKGTLIRLKCPESCDRYVKAGVTPESTGTFTATTITAWFELGAKPTTI